MELAQTIPNEEKRVIPFQSRAFISVKILGQFIELQHKLLLLLTITYT